MDLSAVILNAKLGRERRDAQIDTCSIFAAALVDVLTENGVQADFCSASFVILPGDRASWHHAVVKVGDTFFDSMGEFNHEIVRARTKTHKTVKSRLDFRSDQRDEVEEDELAELLEFFVKKLRISFHQQD